MNEETNMLLGEFVGYKIENKRFQSLEYHSSNESHWEWNEGEIVTLNGSEVCDSSQEPYFSLEDLPFDTDWNWLMEVVMKINQFENQRFSCLINSMDCNIYDNVNSEIVVTSFGDFNTEQLKESIYTACVKFIKWYNDSSNTVQK